MSQILNTKEAVDFLGFTEGTYGLEMRARSGQMPGAHYDAQTKQWRWHRKQLQAYLDGRRVNLNPFERLQLLGKCQPIQVGRPKS